MIKSIEYRGQKWFRKIIRFWRLNIFRPEFARNIHIVCRKQSEMGDIYNLYQEFYIYSLQEYVKFKVFSDRDKYDNSFQNYPLSDFHFNVIGQYAVILKNGRSVRVAIDSDDHPSIQSPEILDWADVYFKTNLWPRHPYPAKVRPIVTGNSMVNMNSVGTLKSLRSLPKKYDFLFVSRIYAGPGANVEHNLRLFEELAKIPCRSKIRAIFIGFNPDDTQLGVYQKRLQAAGVEATDKHFSYQELMSMSAESRICVIRAGIHSCITWRLLNMLAIGAAVVLDAQPFSSWPEPLQDGQNFLSLGLRITPDCGPAPFEDYEKIVVKMKAFLSDESALVRIRKGNARYFDEHAHPMKVAKYLLEQVGNFLQ